MVALFCLGVVFVQITVVSLWAMASAEEGYEDATGFHHDSRGHTAQTKFGLGCDPAKEAGQSPPFVATS
jgi:hypothetical protein